MAKIAIGRPPKSMAVHNALTYGAIAVGIAKEGPISYDDAVVLSRNHVSGAQTHPHPHQFVDYCLRHGWLRWVGLVEAG